MLYPKHWSLTFEQRSSKYGNQRQSHCLTHAGLSFHRGYTIKFLTGLDYQQRLTLGFACTWMCVDCGLVAFTRIYIQNAMSLKKSGEITKNIYTLYFLQQTLMRQN